MPIDVERARRDTPAASQVLHFNNAGAALMPAPVLQAQLRHLRLEAETGGYEAAAAAGDRIETIYDSIARLLNADRAEVAPVANAGRARGGRGPRVAGRAPSPGAGALFATCAGRLGPAATAPTRAWAPAASRTGNATSRGSSASAPRSATRSGGVSPT